MKYFFILCFSLILCPAAIASNPLLEKAHKKFKEKDYKEALSLYDQCVNADWYDLEARNGRGLCKVMLKDYSGAVKDFTAVIEKDSEYYDAWIGRAEAYSWQELYKMAITNAEYAIKLDSSRYEGYMWKGTALRYARNYDEALVYINKALGMAPENVWALCIRAEIYREMGQTLLCLQDMETVVRLDPQPGFIMNLAFSHSENGNYRRADSLFKILYNQDDKNPLVLNNYGYVKFKLGELKEAKSLINKSLKYFNTNSYAFRNLALIALAEGNKEEACKNIGLGLENGFTRDYGDELKKLDEQHCQ